MKTSVLMDEEDGAGDDGSELFPSTPRESKKSFDFRFVLDIFWITFAALLLVKFFNVY